MPSSSRPQPPVSAHGKKLVLTLLVVVMLGASGAPALSPAEIVSRHSIRAIDPATPATDFTLPALTGETVSLSDYHGSWVLLTFFATWCGPCRSEMPSLERLHQQLTDYGLVVLAVSVDQQQQVIEPFIKRLGLTFPVLWDERGEAARTYRASSIPISYLIDPTGRLVGVSRGARDWASLAPMVNDLLAEIPPDSDPTRAYVAADTGPVELPSTVEPPTAEVSLLTQSPTAGTPFFLEVRLNWAGSFEEYLPQPPQVHLPEGIERRQVTASTSSRDGRNIVTYRMQLLAGEAGSYALDPVELRYLTRTEAQPLTSRLLGPTVQVQRRTIAGLPPLVFTLCCSGLVVAGGLGILLLRKYRSGSKKTAIPKDQDRYQQLRKRFDEARARRMLGDPAACVLLLAEIDQELGDSGSEEPLVANLEEVVERARYGGQAPPADELDLIQRRLERRLDALRPDPDKKQREAIRLADTTEQPDKLELGLEQKKSN
jgi:peroxiredoxin